MGVILEVKVGQELLQTMGFRVFIPLVAACPGCGRTTSTTFQELAREIQEIEDQLRRRSNSELVIKEQNVGQSGLAANDEAEAYARLFARIRSVNRLNK